MGDPKDTNTGFLEGAFRWLQIVVPVLAVVIGGGLSLLNSNYWKGVGGSIVAAGVIALIAFLTYGDLLGRRRQAQLDEQTITLADIKASCERLEDRRKRDEVAKRVGLDECYDGRPDPEIEEAVLKAAKTVDILEVSMQTMRELDASDWLGCEAQVRIILLDPRFPEGEKTLADLRDEEEEQGPKAILGEIRKVLRSLPAAWMGDGEGESESP